MRQVDSTDSTSPLITLFNLASFRHRFFVVSSRVSPERSLFNGCVRLSISSLQVTSEIFEANATTLGYSEIGPRACPDLKAITSSTARII